MNVGRGHDPADHLKIYEWYMITNHVSFLQTTSLPDIETGSAGS